MGAAFTLLELEKAATRNIALEADGQPIVIAVWVFVGEKFVRQGFKPADVERLSVSLAKALRDLLLRVAWLQT
jgi:hypothetical protein